MHLLSDSEIERHAYCVAQSGYTLLDQQISQDDIAVYRSASEKALAARLRRNPSSNPACAIDCLYTWDARVLRILENKNLTRLGRVLMKREIKLFNLTAQIALPEGEYGTDKSKLDYEADGDFWHRDFPPGESDAPLNYLWCFTCLIDVGPENGATWLVPGTNRRQHYLSEPEHNVPGTFPSAIQIESKAGDVLVIDPTMWHEMGHNYTNDPRWILFLGYCAKGLRSQRNHWQISGDCLRQDFGETAHALFHPTDGHDDGTNNGPLCLPDDWQVTLE